MITKTIEVEEPCTYPEREPGVWHVQHGIAAHILAVPPDGVEWTAIAMEGGPRWFAGCNVSNPVANPQVPPEVAAFAAERFRTVSSLHIRDRENYCSHRRWFAIKVTP